MSVEPTRIASAPASSAAAPCARDSIAALGDDDAVARRRARRARAARARSIAKVARSRALIPIDRRVERDRALELLRVVRLDERVEPELVGARQQLARRARRRGRAAGAARRRRRPRAARAQLVLGREESLREQRQRRSPRARRAGRRQVPPKRSSTSIETAAAPARSYAARERGRVGVGPQVAGRRRAALDLGDRGEPGPASASREAPISRHLAARTRRARRAARRRRPSRPPRARARAPRAGRRRDPPPRSRRPR